MTRPAGAPTRANRSSQKLWRGIDERIANNPAAPEFAVNGTAGLASPFGAGGPGSSGGGEVPPTPTPQGPLHSPWYAYPIAVANNANTNYAFGLKTVLTTVAVRYYWRRYVGAGSDPVGLGKLTILHDGTTPTLLMEKEWGADSVASGLTLSANISSNQVRLNVAADNSGGAVAFYIQYEYEGVTAASAKGEVSVVRGTRRTQGSWGVVTNGISAYPYYAPRGSDDCGLTIAASIASGVLTVSASADSSDADASAVSLTALVTGFGGIRAWQRDNLAVAAGGSASAPYRSDADGQIDWGSADLTIPASSSDSAIFDPAFGAVWLLIDVYRGTLCELHEVPLWQDYAGVHLTDDDIWVDQAAGVSFTADLVGAALKLIATTDAITDSATVRLAFLGAPALV